MIGILLCHVAVRVGVATWCASCCQGSEGEEFWEVVLWITTLLHVTFRLTPSVCVGDWGYGGLMWRKDPGEGHSFHYLPRKPCVFCDLLCSFSVWPGPAQTDKRSG